MAIKRTVAVALAENLNRLMEHHRLTQQQFAHKAGVAQRTISTLLNVESPATINPRAQTIDAIARVFGVPAWQLMIPDLPLDLLMSPKLTRLVENYRDAPEPGRQSVERIADSEVRYAQLHKRETDDA